MIVVNLQLYVVIMFAASFPSAPSLHKRCLYCSLPMILMDKNNVLPAIFVKLSFEA